MRRISLLQILAFEFIMVVIVGISLIATWILVGLVELHAFHGVVFVAVAVVMFYACAACSFRLLLTLFPLRHGEIQPGSTSEFIAQIYILHLLIIFNTLIRTHFVPIPLMRWVYIALGAKLGANSYSAGALLDPPLTKMGRNCIVGHDAAVFAHIIEGSRFELSPVRIGDDVTIGAHAVVMPGVEIDDGAVVSVGAVVTKDTRIGAAEIWGGVPARLVGRRKDYQPSDPQTSGTDSAS